MIKKIPFFIYHRTLHPNEEWGLRKARRRTRKALRKQVAAFSSKERHLFPTIIKSEKLLKNKLYLNKNLKFYYKTMIRLNFLCEKMKNSIKLQDTITKIKLLQYEESWLEFSLYIRKKLKYRPVAKVLHERWDKKVEHIKKKKMYYSIFKISKS